MKLVNKLLSLFLLCCFFSYSQIIEEFNSFNSAGEWTTNSINVDSHAGALCYTVIGTYPANIWYMAESPDYDFSAYSQVDLEWSQEIDLRSGDLLRLYYFDSNDALWYYYELAGLANGVYYTTIPNTATKITFDLLTVGSGNRSGKYAHIDYLTIFAPTVLPVQLTEFGVEYYKGVNNILWVTESELNCDKYIIEKSVDGFYWGPITEVRGMGTTADMTEYEVVDRNIEYTVNYYKLIQYDYDGNYTEYGPVSIDNTADKPKLVMMLDELGRGVSANKKGIVIEYYDDGTIIKKYQ
jgi:hypothetical protein